jgi:purine-nucleoside/S-methyl-5'-thioadenosine phosphorylase / adenosine deaminase
MTQQTSKLWLWADWPAPKHVRAGTSIRACGHSKTPYNELNLAQHVGDNFADVKNNRKNLSDHLKLKSEPIWLNQSHSSNIISIDNTPENRNADGSFTTKQNKVCTILTADCVPILFCNKEGTKIAAIHAGWKGICAGIIDKAIKTFSEPETTLVWIGPCISNEHYEVDTEVYERCLNHSNLLKKAFQHTNIDHWQCNLVKIVKIILKNAGIGAIYECSLCTYKRDKLFFSYRREGITGRTASMIWME